MNDLDPFGSGWVEFVAIMAVICAIGLIFAGVA